MVTIQRHSTQTFLLKWNMPWYHPSYRFGAIPEGRTRKVSSKVHTRPHIAFLFFSLRLSARQNVKTFIVSLWPDCGSCPCPVKEELPACRSHHLPPLNTVQIWRLWRDASLVLEPTAPNNGLRAKNSLEKLIRKPLLSAFHHSAELLPRQDWIQPRRNYDQTRLPLPLSLSRSDSVRHSKEFFKGRVARRPCLKVSLAS